MSHLTRLNILIYICLLIFSALILVSIGDFFNLLAHIVLDLFDYMYA